MSNRQIYLALYKGHRDGSGWRVWCARATDWLTRILTRGQYSHAEIAVRLPENDVADAAQYECYSASIRDGGVRLKTMPLPGNKWDLIDLSTDPLLAARLFTVWQLTRAKPYDLTGHSGWCLSSARIRGGGFARNGARRCWACRTVGAFRRMIWRRF